MRSTFSLFLIVLLLSCFSLTAQDYEISAIAPELFLNANAVVRSEEISIEVKSIDKIIIHKKRAVTVLNEYGERHALAADVYDKDRKIKDQEAYIYDEYGEEIRKIKKRHFKDHSLVTGGTLHSDNRVSYFDYTPNKYPYTLVYESEVQSSSTIFIKPWEPMSDYLISVEQARYQFKNPSQIPIRFDERNMPEKVERTASKYELNYSVSNLPARQQEALSPDFTEFSPKLLVALEDFSLIGVKGHAKNWEDLGRWQYENLISERGRLPETTLAKIEKLTAEATSDSEKARIIYNFMQENTRYVSVQLGIGGWQPIRASEVDKLGYGDCKALTNYMMALLQSQGIASNYAVVYGGEHRNIDAKFASMEGNHVILQVPQENDETVWLECTNQNLPFNYLGDFTDNRNVLLVKPGGGEIVSTKKYLPEENLQKSKTNIQLNDEGGFLASTKRVSKGIPYGNTYYIERRKKRNQILSYKEEWGYLKNIDIARLEFENNKQMPSFTEIVEFTGEKLALKVGKRFLLPLNFFKPEVEKLPRNTHRKLPVEIKRGKMFQDGFIYHLPEGYTAEAIPESVNIENEFGRYVLDVVLKKVEGKEVLTVNREYVVNEGRWNPEKYEDYREFLNLILALNNQKAVLAATH